MKNWLIVLLLWVCLPIGSFARDLPAHHLSRFAAGAGPTYGDAVYRLLDGEATPGQSNAVAFDAEHAGVFATLMLSCRLRVLEGGDGGALIFLNTAEYGSRGPAPFVKNWTEPNLTGSFAVGIDVHDPPDDDPSGPFGNYRGLPERQVSLHWNGREIVKRLAKAEFRGDFSECEILVRNVAGGAEVTVRLAGSPVYDGYFIAGMLPYEARLAVGASTRDDATTEFDIKELSFTVAGPEESRRGPQHIEIFNHVLTGSAASTNITTVTLPSAGWAYARVILTLEVHDAGDYWDEWDRNGSLYIVNDDGVKYDIVPFVTSFRTPCHWQVDVTPFRPWLAGKVTFEIATDSAPGSDRGFMMSAALDFYPGEPELEPYHVVPVWVGTAQYRSVDNHFRDFFTPKTVDIDEQAEVVRLFMTTTGHSQVGEFTPAQRSLIVTAGPDSPTARKQRFEDLLWRSDCYLNPNRPQNGTWKYSRSGWAPGDVVRPWQIDLTPYVVPGKTAELRYEPWPYDFSHLPEDKRPTEDQINQAIQIVRAYLVLYRPATQLMTAPYLKVLQVVDDSNAARAGIRVGDYLLSYDGRQQRTIDELRNTIKDAETAGKERIVAVVYRGGEQVETVLGPGLIGIVLQEQ